MTTTHADPPNGRHPGHVAGACDDVDCAADHTLPEMPDLPDLPGLSELSDLSGVPELSDLPGLPGVRQPRAPRTPRDRWSGPKASDSIATGPVVGDPIADGPKASEPIAVDPNSGNPGEPHNPALLAPEPRDRAPRDRTAQDPDPRSPRPDRAPRRRPGRPRSEAAERAILDAVLELLGQGVPYRSLSMEQVAARAAVGKATVYRRWPNKESLVVDAVTSLWTDCPAPDLTDGRSTRDRLVEYLVTMADLMHADRAGLVFASVMATGMTNPELVRRYQEVAIEPRREQVRMILRHGIAQGELRPDLDIELTVRMLAGPIVHTMKTECLGEPLPEGFAANLVDALLQGAAAR